MHSHPLVTKLKLFGHQFHVFSQSFQCYGVVQAGLRYKALLLQVRVIQIKIYFRFATLTPTLI